MGFSRRKIPRSSAYTISEKAIRFRHPDYDPDRAQKLISSSMSWHLSTRNISSKSMHAFLSNLANRQTDRQTRVKTCTSSFVGGKNTPWIDMNIYAVKYDRTFCRAMLCKRCLSRHHGAMRCLSVRLSVRPSRSYILSKRIKISSKFFHCWVDKPF